MNLVLPPKRFQSTEDSKYDPIRFNKWFKKLETRREKLPMLKQAYEFYQLGGKLQSEICTEWGIDSREFRDYCDFREEYSGFELFAPQVRKDYQAILDSSYRQFNLEGGSRAFLAIILAETRFWAYLPRAVGEVWECDCAYWPTGYQF